MRKLLHLLLLLLFVSCGSSDDDNDTIPELPRQTINPPLPKLTLNQELKVLFIGSSWLNDAAKLVRDVAHASELKVNVGNIYMGGFTYGQMVQYFGDNTLCNYYEWDSDGSPMYSKQSTLQNAITLKNWDIIVIQQAARESFYFDTFTPCMRQWIDILKKTATNPNMFIAMNHAWTPNKNGPYIASYGFSSQKEMWEITLKNIIRASSESGIDLVIPCGMAVYSLRTTSLENNIDITRDNLHLDSGIGVYLTACTVFEALFKPIFNISVLGNQYRSTDTTSRYGYTPVTDKNAEIIQKCAISANSNKFRYTDFIGVM